MRLLVAILLAICAILLALCLPAVAAASAQSLSDETSLWLADTLHTPVPAPQVEQVTPGQWGSALAYSVPSNDGAVRLVAAPWLVSRWDGIDRGTVYREDPVAQHLLLHELLHLHRASLFEEGAADAVALDLVSAWLHRFQGGGSAGYGVPAHDAAYPAQVRLVRALSAAATGKRWRSRDARLWRRALLLGDDAARRAMVDQANGSAWR